MECYCNTIVNDKENYFIRNCEFRDAFVIIFNRNKKYHPLKKSENLKLVQNAC